MKHRPIPPRQWRYAPHYLCHAAVGALVALGILTAPEVHDPVAVYAVFAGSSFLIYQCIEFLRRGDTPARDIADFMVGLLLAGAGYAAYEALWGG